MNLQQAADFVRTITVFCGSKDGNKPVYVRKAHDMGQIIAEHKKRLLYGGGAYGCMGTMGKSCVAHGGAVTGVIPRFLLEKEGHSGFLNEPPHELIIVDGEYADAMAVRKKIFFTRGDVIVTLPGGWGSDDEEFEGLTGRKLDQICKPHILVNIDGFWDHKIAQTARQVADGFVSPEQAAKRIIVNRVEDVLPAAYQSVIQAYFGTDGDTVVPFTTQQAAG